MWPHPWPWPWIFKVQYGINISRETEGQLIWSKSHIKGCESLGCWTYYMYAGIILCMRLANKRWCYNVTSSLIGWERTQHDPWLCDSRLVGGEWVEEGGSKGICRPGMDDAWMDDWMMFIAWALSYICMRLFSSSTIQEMRSYQWRNGVLCPLIYCSCPRISGGWKDDWTSAMSGFVSLPFLTNQKIISVIFLIGRI